VFWYVEVVDGRPTILVGHSGAGPLLAAMGESLGCVEGYVFVDAGPVSGQELVRQRAPELAGQLLDMASGRWLPPWSQWWGPDSSPSSAAESSDSPPDSAALPR